MTTNSFRAQASAKLTPASDQAEAIRSLEATDGVLHAEPMFPGETDRALASLVALVLDGSRALKTLSELQKRSFIEHAALMAERGLIA